MRHFPALLACSLVLTVLCARATAQPHAETPTEIFKQQADSLFSAEVYAEAVPLYEEIVRRDPDFGEVWFRLGSARLNVADFAGAVEAFGRANDLGFRSTSAMYNMACAYSLAGDPARAMGWLERTVAAGFGNKYLLLIDGDLDGVRDEPRYDRLMSSYFGTAGYPELSQPTQRICNTGLTQVPMRDGVHLATEVVLPEGTGPFPTILVRTPYGRGFQVFHRAHWAARGYALVVQDVRGRGESEGAWEPWLNEREDGYDTLEWISQQPWSNGLVGMIGASYVAQVQWLAAAEGHPALRAILPLVSGTDPFFDTPYDHGILKTGLLDWSFSTTYPDEEAPDLDPATLYTLPLSEVDNARFGVNVPVWDTWVAMDAPQAWQRASFLADLGDVDIPVLHVSGLWDVESIATARNWTTLHALGHDRHWLVFGPWAHQDFIAPTPTNRGDIEYGEAALINMPELWVRWFDQWLKEKEVGWPDRPHVSVFLTGPNRWASFEAWPPEDAEPSAWYLDASEEMAGVYALRAEAPPAAGKLGYRYDPEIVPMQADPSFSESTVFAVDLAREDEVRFATAALEAPVTVVGPVELDLSFSTTTPDTDFFVFLLDIDEHGTARALGQPGKIRGRFAMDWDDPQPLEAGRVYQVRIPMFPVAHRFELGHRVGLAIRSDWFPRFSRNLNTVEPASRAVETRTAEQTIHLGGAHPSALRLHTVKIHDE